MDSQSIDWKYLFGTTRARVYLLWAVLVLAGFVTTHFYQNHGVMYVWTVLSAVGFGYMAKVMPLHVKLMQRIFLAWLVPVAIGMTVSGSVFYLHQPWAANLLGHLGAYWLLVMAIGFAWNGMVDRPSLWYWVAVAMNVVAGVACFTVDALLPGQYLIAAIVGAWSMLNLWIFRS